MAANFTFCATGLKDPNSAAALWGHYTKGGAGKRSESATGADFALVIPVGKRCRVAIVQAKITDGGTASLYQEGTDNHPAEQMDKLYALGRYWMRELGMDEKCAGDWMHYLLWTKTIPRALTLNQAMQDNTGKGRNVEVKKYGSFATLALAACAPEAFGDKTLVHKGWLELDMREATTRLPDLLPIVDVVLADQGGGGAALAKALSKQSLTKTRKVVAAGNVSVKPTTGLKYKK
ncbi:hypothetical protein IP92_04714 [Pseudoduganella flava]|uniref:DUF4365 domain-containing protein n=1 Tax=Pseudoduganella flava TaxID=871742 RepID=A0A562PGU4_9BURK|nr:hypothetical protein [Pseudoduganella flava]QGZ42513.1 hypothetical protein GO485_28100 [Pseudoduganella flava]TWI43661.1 hypothetical protein IP92_04714 [Pseudoduganella flava]